MSHELTQSTPATGKSFGKYARRVPILIDNKGPRRLDWPVSIAVSEIRKTAPDFNPDNCAVVAPQRWLDWREIPHQVDTIDSTRGAELSFMVDLPDNDAVTYYLYYSADNPPVGAAGQFAARTATAEDWVPPNIGWENPCVAYRM